MEKRVVIADDFRSIRNVVRKTLEKKGFIVLEAEDGLEALKYFDGSEICLLISDFDMPNMNGAELAVEIRKLEKYKDTPIMMLTSNKRKRKEDEIAGLKIDDWIVKPFDVSNFYNIIETLIK